MYLGQEMLYFIQLQLKNKVQEWNRMNNKKKIFIQKQKYKMWGLSPVTSFFVKKKQKKKINQEKRSSKSASKSTRASPRGSSVETSTPWFSSVVGTAVVITVEGGTETTGVGEMDW